MNLLHRNSPFNFDSLFDHVWLPLRQAADTEENASFVPRVDIKDKKNRYEISAELPGIDKDDVKVELDEGLLTIEAETNQENTEEKDGEIIRQERRYGKFVRSFNVEKGIKESDISAEFKNGVLRLDIPKTEEQEHEVKRISIK